RYSRAYHKQRSLRFRLGFEILMSQVLKITLWEPRQPGQATRDRQPIICQAYAALGKSIFRVKIAHKMTLWATSVTWGTDDVRQDLFSSHTLASSARITNVRQPCHICACLKITILACFT